MQLTAVAKKGIAKEHAKWSPVAVATYKFEPVIEINEEREALLSPDQKAEFVEICPAKVGCVLVDPRGDTVRYRDCLNDYFQDFLGDKRYDQANRFFTRKNYLEVILLLIVVRDTR